MLTGLTPAASGLVRNAVAAATGPLRATLGRRNINWTPEFMGFGNQLYLWAWAHQHQAERQAPHVLMTDKMRYWAGLVPGFAQRFLIERRGVSLLDQRGNYWAEPMKYTGDRRGFTEASRAAFLTDLLDEPLLRGVGTGPLASDDVLVVNVRRGDFYSPHFIAEHGMDVAAYLTIALARSLDAQGAVRRLHVVSDDIVWCREQGLEAYASTVTYAEGETPAQNLLDVASARRLVITNSTFSLWAAFVSNLVHGDNQASVWAPAFFQRRYGSGRCYEYDASWSFVDDLPGGWQPNWMLESA